MNDVDQTAAQLDATDPLAEFRAEFELPEGCLLYTSDAADE